MKNKVVFLACCAILSNSMLAAAQGPVPFKAMMQSGGTQQVAPPMPNGDSSQSPAASTKAKPAGRLTAKGKGMIVGGFVLVAAGALVIGVDAALGSAWGTKATGGKTTAGYIGGAAALGGGVTLVIFGDRSRTK